MIELAVPKPVSIVPDLPPIIAVLLPGKRIGATLRSLCEGLDLNRVGQMQRIRRTASLADALKDAVIATSGGPQRADVLLHWAIPLWLASLHTSRLSEAKRTLALILQREAVSILERAFAQPEQAFFEPIPEDPPDGWEQIKQGFSRTIDGLTVVEADHQTLTRRVAVIEAEHQSLLLRVAALEAPQARPEVGYSPQRLAQLYLLARGLRAQQGRPIAETLAATAADFGVADASDLPDSAWPDALVWFNRQIG